MKVYQTKHLSLSIMLGILLFSGCALNDPEVQADTGDFPFRLILDEEGADLPESEDYSAEVSFADYLGELPSSEIVLNYVLTGEGDFSNVAIDEIMYEYEDDDCVFIYEVSFTSGTITIPVDENTGTVPEAIEIVFAHNLPAEEAGDGGYTLELTMLESPDNVVLNDVTVFEYGILENDVAGEWVYEIISEAAFDEFKEVFGPISPDLAALSFEEISGEVKFEFEFEEVKIEIELNETEIVEECEDGETESEEENVIIEIEAEYEAEDGELTLEGSYFTEDGEELDYLIETGYTFDSEDDLKLEVLSVVDEDNFEEGEELFAGEVSLYLIRD